jgi:hypothetical protein
VPDPLAGAYDEIPDSAVLVVKLCRDQNPTDLDAQAACVNDASREFVARASTCTGMPTDSSSLFPGKGKLSGKNCKASQSAQRNPHLYFESAEAQPDTTPITKCASQTLDGELSYVFSDSAPKLSGFYHNLFYVALADGGDAKTAEAAPSERFETKVGYDHYTLPGMFTQEQSPKAGNVMKTFAVDSAHYEVWDFEASLVRTPFSVAHCLIHCRRLTFRTITATRTILSMP